MTSVCHVRVLTGVFQNQATADGPQYTLGGIRGYLGLLRKITPVVLPYWDKMLLRVVITQANAFISVFGVIAIQRSIDDALATEHQNNYKSMLQQHAQRHWNITPDYVLLDEKGPAHTRCFEIAVVMRGRNYPSAWGTNKKEAEQEAARLALIDLGLLAELPQD